MRHRKLLAIVFVLAAFLQGCRDTPANQSPAGSSLAPETILQAADLSDPMRPSANFEPIQLRAARNEWVSFPLQISNVFSTRPLFIRVSALSSTKADVIEPNRWDAYQVLPMPFKVNPGYVRQTGINSANRAAPRALLSVPVQSGMISLASLRDPTQPTNPSTHPNGGTLLLWMEFHIPANLTAGDYTGRCDLADSQGQPIGASIPLNLTIDDFNLPDDRHLRIVGRLNWDRLASLYPETFGDIAPNLMNRGDPRYQRAISMLDRLVIECEKNRVALQIPALRPTVKWPAGEPPQIQWNEFDSVVSPWVSGVLFADRLPLKSWAMPSALALDHYDSKSRGDYWSLATAHFEQLGWLDRSAIWLDSTGDEGAVIAEAGRLLSANSKVSVAIPLHARDLETHAELLDALNKGRVLCAADPIVSQAHSTDPTSQGLRRFWLATDLPGSVADGSDERDIRSWSWLAFLRGAETVVWDSVFPAFDSADQPADPQSVIWFYPGQWFGVDAPLQTLQLKWLRRAQQDYEYLWLAQQRGEGKRALEMARLVTKPVEVEPGRSPDPEFALLSGTTSRSSWDHARDLLAQSILLHGSGRGVDQARQQALLIEMMQWAEPQERPLLLARSATWSLRRGELDRPDHADDHLDLKLGLDVYNASNSDSVRDQLQWSPAPPIGGWEFPSNPLTLPRLQTYRVQTATLSAQFNLRRNVPNSTPIEVSFINGFTRIAHPLKVRLPVAQIEQREGPIELDGKLDDWTDAQALQDGPLVLMLNRPGLHRQEIQFAERSAKLYGSWSRDQFDVAFSLEGLSTDTHQSHNDVYYQARRAWGEDLCEILVQPVYADGSLGPLLHVVCKPTGADWVQRKESSHEFGEDWRTTEGSGARYATTTTTDGRWRGELGIPWKLINSDDKTAPVLLRFNFSQHCQQNCESASWCGPVDFGRDENLMGALYLKHAAMDVGTGFEAKR